MLSFTGQRIFLIAGATDMRKSINSLSGIARELLGANPQSRNLYLFCNRYRNRLKVLVFDESGVWVLAKRLDQGTFDWPRGTETEATALLGHPRPQPKRRQPILLRQILGRVRILHQPIRQPPKPIMMGLKGRQVQG